MNKDNLILIAAAAVGLYFIARVAKSMGGASPSVTGAARATAVPNSDMTLAQQYAEYGYGASVADVYNSAGYLGTIK